MGCTTSAARVRVEVLSQSADRLGTAAGGRLKKLPRYKGVCRSHFWRQGLPVHVHRGLNIRVPHQVLHLCRVDLRGGHPRLVRVPERVPA